MCGLGGELRFDRRRADEDALRRMSPCLTPRGPDSNGLLVRGRVGLIHHRLKIIDLSDVAGQPMVDDELGLALVFNGCIYNYEQLRTQLRSRGHQFRSHSDTEVILRAYAEWGPRCVERFAGMFAFAVADLRTGQLVLARDRLGIKPLYLSTDKHRLRFASTLPALVAAGDVDTDVDPISLHHYLSWHGVVPAPRTMLVGVQKLPAATVRTVEPDGTWSDVGYWAPPYERTDAGFTNRSDWADAVREGLLRAVARRTVSDVPHGVLLSGGLDSSLIVGLLAEMGHGDIKTFSIGFDSSSGQQGDEFAFSDLVAARFATDHHKIHVPEVDLAPAVESSVAAMSEPMVSHDCVAFHLLSREVTKDVRVVQCGQGADELFAGYDWYPPLAAASHAVTSRRHTRRSSSTARTSR